MLFLFASLVLLTGFSQEENTYLDLKKKADWFKNLNFNDSALSYYLRIEEFQGSQLTDQEFINNKINIAEVLIQQKKFNLSGNRITDLEQFLMSQPAASYDLQAGFLQVKGAQLLGFGQDSAGYYLMKSIEIRSGQHGEADTNLHFAWNKLGNYYLLKGDYGQAYNCHKKALEVSLKKANAGNYQSATSYQNLGISVHLQGNYNEAENYFLKSLEINEKLYDSLNPSLAYIYNNIGKFYHDLSKYSLALKYYNKGEELINKNINDDLRDLLAVIYGNKGNLYTHQGDFQIAISYLHKSQSLFEINISKNLNYYLRTLMDIGVAYEKKGDYKQAVYYYGESAKNPNQPSVVKTYRNLGNLYSNLGQTDSALYFYKKAIQATEHFYGNDSYDMALCYQYLGEALFKSDNDSAIWYYEEALKVLSSRFEQNNRDVAKVRILIGNYRIAKKNYKEAIAVIHDAINGLIGVDYKSYLNGSLISSIPRDLYTPDALYQKSRAQYLLYIDNQNISLLYEGLTNLKLALHIIDLIRSTYYDEESQLILNNNARLVVDLGLLISETLYRKTSSPDYLQEAFQFSEKGKALILLSALRGLEAKTNANLPKEMIDKEDELSQEIALYNNFIYTENQKARPDAAKVTLWNDRLFSLRRAYDSLLIAFQANFPAYYGLKYDYTIIAMDSLSANLPADQVILEYHMADTLLYGICIGKDSYKIKELGRVDKLAEGLESLHIFFLHQDFLNTGMEDYQKFIQAASGLYKMLIDPFKSEIDNKRLVVIPDGELGFLTFDILLTTDVTGATIDFRDLPWLIRTNPISYSSSATIYYEQNIQRHARKPSGKILAMAPSYGSGSETREVTDTAFFSLTPLSGAREEINFISEIFSTKKLFDLKASEFNFKNQAPDYGILHLAMHTIIDNEKPLYSKLIFSAPEGNSPEDGLLNTYELFNLKLKGDLAVLSACNTGTGRLERGEGIISLARGFFYAGIPSVVMTLWEIEDHSSADLMAYFYKNLKKGIPTDVALQQSKLEYLVQADPINTHPYFWAGFVNIGKTSAVSVKSNAMYWKWALYATIFAIALTIAIIFINNRVYFKKKKL